MEGIGCHYSLEINYDNVNFTSSQVSELFPAAIMSVVLLKVLNDGPELNMKFALCYVALLGAMSVVQAVTTQHYDYLTELWGLKLKVALIGLVYKKVRSFIV